MPGIVGLMIVAVFAFVIFAPLASRRLRRAGQAMGTAAVPPPSCRSAGGTAVAVEIQPSSVMTDPFAYDNGLIVGRTEDP